MFLIFLLAAISVAAVSVLEKTIVRKRKISVGLYQCSSFLAIILLMLPLLYFFWEVNPSALTTKNIIIFLLIVIFSVAANLLSFYSLKREKITNIEPVRLLEPLFVVLLAIIFSFIFGELMFERNTKVIIPAFFDCIMCINLFTHKKAPF